MALDFSNLLGSVTQGVIGGVTGNPIAAAAGIAGLGLELAGTAKGAADSSKFNAAGQQYSAAMNQYFNTVQPLQAQKTQGDIQVAQNEQRIQEINRNYMEVTNQRQQLENLRNAQKSQSLAMSNAANQGAQFGSGVKGGVAGVTGQAGVNFTGLSAGLQMGENIFDINANTSQTRIAQFGTESAINRATTTMEYAKQQYALAGSNYNVAMSTNQGMSRLGGSLLSSAPTLGKLFSGT